MRLEITYENWKATVNITDYMVGRLPFLGATPEDSDCGDSSSVDFLIEKVESTSELADPSMLSYFCSSEFTDEVESLWSKELEESNQPDFDDFDDYDYDVAI
mgnify:FL=1|tara:strand:- start:1554 stop:1859 length:306 start_codon:yes stop_codon:yes gene_type:complete